MIFRSPVPPYSLLSTFPCGSLLASVGLWLGLAGCSSPAVRHLDFGNRRPAMPTIALDPAAEAKPARRSDAEILAAAARQARTREIRAAVLTVQAGRDPADRGRLGLELVELLADENAPLAAQVALALPPGTAQASALAVAGRAWAQADPSEALPWAMRLSDMNAALVARRAVTSELVQRDPQVAIERIRAMLASNDRDDTLVLAAGAWARLNADDAIAWLRTLPEDALRERLTSGIGFEIAQTSPQRALELAELLPEGRNRWLLMSAIGQTWVAVDTRAALSWAQELPAGAARDAALAGVETGLGVPSKRQIASAPGARGSSRTRGGAAAALAARDMDASTFAAWLATQPPGLSRDDAILEYVRQRGVAEPEAVGQMLAQLPGGIRQRAIELHVDNLLVGSPDRAAEFLRSLPRSEQSPEAIERTARRLLHTNRAAAEALLDQALLTPDQKAQLLRDAPP